MLNKEQRQVANTIASVFLASCLARGAAFDVAHAATMEVSANNAIEYEHE